MKELELKIAYQRYESLKDLPEAEQQLCILAEEALQSAYAPYSEFRVGAAVLMDDGEVVLGSNQENVAYPSGLCAERVALFSIGAQRPNAHIVSMAITVKTDKFEVKEPLTSCGACLQVMSEFEHRQGAAYSVLFYCVGGAIIKVKSVRDLIPFAFVEDRLAAPKQHKV